MENQGLPLHFNEEDDEEARAFEEEGAKLRAARTRDVDLDDEEDAGEELDSGCAAVLEELREANARLSPVQRVI